MKKTQIIIIILLLPFLSYNQKLISTDSTLIISKLIESEYLPYEKISFNNGKIKANTDWKLVLKIFKPIKEKCKIIDELGEFDTYCYYLGKNKTRLGGSLNVIKIKDNTLKFDFFKELYSGAPALNIKKYFPNNFKYKFEKYFPQYMKEKRTTFLLILEVENHKGYYPDNMGFMTMGIEIELKSMKIMSFEFFDQYQ
jgi:hypothetical protein